MEKRESFNSKWGFILACIGSAVGMGNLWMFPTRVSLYGGGSFLIPYFIFVALIGSTGVIGEMCLGRGTRSGPIDAFGAACETRGRRKLGDALGFIPAAGSLAMAIGYTVVMGWILNMPSEPLPVPRLPRPTQTVLPLLSARWRPHLETMAGSLPPSSSAF